MKRAIVIAIVLFISACAVEGAAPPVGAYHLHYSCPAGWGASTEFEVTPDLVVQSPDQRTTGKVSCDEDGTCRVDLYRAEPGGDCAILRHGAISVAASGEVRALGGTVSEVCPGMAHLHGCEVTAE